MGFKITEVYADITARDTQYKSAMATAQSTARTLSTVFDQLRGTLLRLAGALSAGYLLRSLMEVEKGIQQVRIGLQLTGQEVTNNTAELTNMARRLSELTGTDMVEYLHAMRQALSYGAPMESMEAMMKTARGLAVVLDTSLRQGVIAVTQAQVGYFLMLQRRLPDLRRITDAHEKFNLAMKAAAAGWAMAQADTLTRNLGILRQSFMNLLRDGLSPLLPYLSRFIQFITTGLGILEAWAKEHKTLAVKLLGVTTGLLLLLPVLPGIAVAVKAVAAAFMFLNSSTALTLAALAAIAYGLAGLLGAFTPVKTIIDKTTEAIKSVTATSPWDSFGSAVARACAIVSVALEHLSDLQEALHHKITYLVTAIPAAFTIPGSKIWYEYMGELNALQQAIDKLERPMEAKIESRYKSLMDTFTALKNLALSPFEAPPYIGKTTKGVGKHVEQFKVFEGGQIDFSWLSPDDPAKNLLEATRENGKKLDTLFEIRDGINRLGMDEGALE